MKKTASEEVKISTEYVNIDDIRPNPRNPRHNDASVAPTAESIKQLSYVNEIVVNEELTIIAGHTRHKALKLLEAQDELGKGKLKDVTADHIKVKIISGLTKDEQTALMLADNKTGEQSTWDEELLSELITEIKIDVAPFGFEDIDVSTIGPVIEPEDDNYNEPADLQVRAKTGDIWQLGDHYLICGDSTDPKVLSDLMSASGEEVKADLLLTDPPYNVGYEEKLNDQVIKTGYGHNSRVEKYGGVLTQIHNDKMDDVQFGEFLTKSFTALSDILKAGGVFYIWHSDIKGRIFRNALAKTDMTIREALIWNKDRPSLSHSDYQWKHEPCLYGWKEGAAHYFINDRTIKTVFDDEQPDIENMTPEEAKRLLKELYDYSTVVNYKKPMKSEYHPTMKPVPLIAKQIINSTREHEAVIDPFGGSGTTLIACEQLARRCYMAELDPHYMTVIINRWEQYTGREAVKIRG